VQHGFSKQVAHFDFSDFSAVFFDDGRPCFELSIYRWHHDCMEARPEQLWRAGVLAPTTAHCITLVLGRV
jgi:hypothetical protein